MEETTSRFRSLRLADARGVSSVAVEATLEVTAVVEGVHRSVQRTLGLPAGARPGRTGGITGLVYRSIEGITRLTGAGLDASLALGEALAQRLAPPNEAGAEVAPRRAVVLGALNGVLGDRLWATSNPLAVPMEFRIDRPGIDQDAAATSSPPGRKILLLVHGLCMSDHCWGNPGTEAAAGSHHGEAIATGLDYTPVYLRYNSGRAITDNGRELAERLERFLAHWPEPVEELTILGHSMGGLLARSAVLHGQRLGHRWPSRLRHLLFLGTPHHGAPLERAGAFLERLLHSTPYTRPFVALARLRSQGIRDLHDGAVLPARDGTERDRSVATTGQGGAEPAFRLPDGVRAFAVAATRSDSRAAAERNGRLGCDGLVPVASALGRHDRAERSLALPRSDCHVVHDTHHLELLRSPAATRQLLAWLEST